MSNEFHGTHARNYNKRPSFWHTKSLIDTARLQLKPGQTLLDVGCGTGKDLEKLFARYGEEVKLYGIDNSKDMLLQVPRAVAESPNVRLKDGRADKLPYTDNSFDYVTCSLVLHHLPQSEQQKALQEMCRVLKSGGTVLIQDWGQPRNVFGRLIAWFWRNHAYVHESSSNDWRLVLSQAGFKQIKILSVKRGVMYQLAGVKLTR